MKNLFANIGINVVAIGCIAIAGYLVIHGKEGWGWFLFGGIICAGRVIVDDKK